MFEPFPRHPRRIPRNQAIAILLLNIVPGLGTAVYGKWERGVLQFLLTFLFFSGFLWALSDAIVVLRHSEPKAQPAQP